MAMYVEQENGFDALGKQLQQEFSISSSRVIQNTMPHSHKDDISIKCTVPKKHMYI